jgi:hypothetical protein
LTSVLATAYELRRIVFSRKYFYLLLLLGVSAYDTLTRSLIHGAFGTAPFSQVSYIKFATMSNPMLLVTIIVLCAGVFSEKELSARKILFSAPISSAMYFGMKGTAIAGAFLLAMTLHVLYSCVYFGWQFRFFQFQDFLHPIVVFMLPGAVFVFGLSMAVGRFGGRFVYALVPLVFFACALNIDLPVWIDLGGNNLFVSYNEMLLRTVGTTEVIYYVPSLFLFSRYLFIAAGIALFCVSCLDKKP